MKPSEFERVEVDVPDAIVDFSSRGEHAYGIEVEGDSMIPTLTRNGKSSWCPNAPVLGVLLWWRLIKRARYDHAYVILESSNPVYEPLVVASTEIVLMHRIA